MSTGRREMDKEYHRLEKQGRYREASLLRDETAHRYESDDWYERDRYESDDSYETDHLRGSL